MVEYRKNEFVRKISVVFKNSRFSEQFSMYTLTVDYFPEKALDNLLILGLKFTSSKKNYFYHITDRNV